MDGPQRNLRHKKQPSLVVVALPAEDDPVRKYSSEKEPHLTLLYLGNFDFNSAELTHIAEYIEHAASQFDEFGLDVVRRGELGDEHADVLFFNKIWTRDVETFRGYLLNNELINWAYRSTDQFPEWLPHLTMGFPESPAKKIDVYDRLSWVRFNRVALWTDDYTGPTFQLKSDNYGMEVGLSQSHLGRGVTADTLTHYGVKGMKWGVTRTDAQLSRSSGRTPRVSDDVKAVDAARRKIERGGTRSLSNKELQQIVERTSLESRYHSTMAEKSSVDKGHDTVKKVLAIGATIESIRRYSQTPTGKAIVAGLKVAAGFAAGGPGGAASAGASVVLSR